MVHITSPNPIGSVIAARIEESGLTLRQISDKSQVPRTTLSRKMQIGGFTVEELSRLAQVFGCNVSDLAAQIEAVA